MKKNLISQASKVWLLWVGAFLFCLSQMACAPQKEFESISLESVSMESNMLQSHIAYRVATQNQNKTVGIPIFALVGKLNRVNDAINSDSENEAGFNKINDGFYGLTKEDVKSVNQDQDPLILIARCRGAKNHYALTSYLNKNNPKIFKCNKNQGDHLEGYVAIYKNNDSTRSRVPVNLYTSKSNRALTILSEKQLDSSNFKANNIVGYAQPYKNPAQSTSSEHYLNYLRDKGPASVQPMNYDGPVMGALYRNDPRVNLTASTMNLKNIRPAVGNWTCRFGSNAYDGLSIPNFSRAIDPDCVVNISISQTVITSVNDHVTIKYDGPSDFECSVSGVNVNADTSDKQTHGISLDRTRGGFELASSIGVVLNIPRQTTRYRVYCQSPSDAGGFSLWSQEVTVYVEPKAGVASMTRTGYTTPTGVILADIFTDRNCGAAVEKVSATLPNENLCVYAFWMAGGSGYDPQACKVPKDTSNKAQGVSRVVRVSKEPYLSSDGKKWIWECAQTTANGCINDKWTLIETRTPCEVPTH
jgi:hypothetical protein